MTLIAVLAFLYLLFLLAKNWNTIYNKIWDKRNTATPDGWDENSYH